MSRHAFHVALALSLSLIPIASLAQSPEDYLTPPKELAKLDFLLGTWTSKGSYTSPEDPSGAKAPWTARSTVTKVLGGHYLQDDLVVEFEGGEIPAYVARTYYGYDRDRGRFFTAAADNSGRVGHADVRVEDGVIVGTMAFDAQGVPAAVRSVSRVKGDEMEFTNVVLFGEADPTTEVEGNGKKEGKPIALGAKEKAAAMAPTSPEMEKLAGIVGKYRVKGSVVPFPGAPKMEIGAAETVESWFGGNVLYMEVLGDSTPGFPAYEGRALIGWDSTKKCYQELVFDNMGAFSVQESHLVEGSIVAFGTSRHYGSPATARSIVSLDEHGSITRVVVDSLGTSGDAMRAFEATYTKEGASKDGEAKAGEAKAGVE